MSSGQEIRTKDGVSLLRGTEPRLSAITSGTRATSHTPRRLAATDSVHRPSILWRSSSRLRETLGGSGTPETPGYREIGRRPPCWPAINCSRGAHTHRLVPRLVPPSRQNLLTSRARQTTVALLPQQDTLHLAHENASWLGSYSELWE